PCSTPTRPACPLFFCPAEDGIRDPLVSGVQTCALPIAGRPRWGRRAADSHPAPRARPAASGPPGPAPTPAGPPRFPALPTRGARSEERRVGQEGRVGGSAKRAERRKEHMTAAGYYRR